MMKEYTILDNFITDNNLEKLEAKLNEFNPFNILKIENQEIRHSNCFGWLLNPKGNHNLGDKLLKKIICDILVSPSYSSDLLSEALTVSKIQRSNFDDAQVMREKLNIDILVISESNRFILLIENKIKAGLSENQLQKYLSKVKELYPDFMILPVFLTLEGYSPPEDSNYIPYSHERIYHVLKFVLELYKENLNIKVFDFLKYYMKTMEVLIMENKDIKKYCKEIYKNHKDAIEMILKYSDEYPTDEVCDDFIKSNNLKELHRSRVYLWFITKEFEVLPRIAENWVTDFPVAYWFEFNIQNNKLGLKLEVGSIRDPEKRLEFMKYLVKEGFKIHHNKLTLNAKYTRIFTKNIDFENWDSKDELLENMNDLFSEKAKEAKKRINKTISNFKWE